MYAAEPRYAVQRHREQLAAASRLRQASQLQALRRAARRAERAERKLAEAQCAVLRARGVLVGDG